MTPAALLGLPARLGRYELRGVLGRGGMGRVVRAHDPVLRRDVALKLVEPVAVEPERLAELRFMFHREARATAALRHPSIIEVYDYSGPGAALPYLACELVDGPTLRDVLDERRRLAPVLVAACGYELARALAHAHEHGIVHRDLKPENVFWTAAGRIVLADFGIAKAFDLSPRLGGTVQYGATTLYGSPAYMAPEQLAGGAVGPASDLFALGALLFEAAAGRPAFGGTSVQEVLDAVSRGARSPSPPEVPPRLERVIDGLLAHAPGDRPGSAHAAAEELRAVLDELGAADPRRALADFGAPAHARDSKLTARTRRRRRRAGLVGIAAVLTALGGTLALLPRARAPLAGREPVIVSVRLPASAVLWVDGADTGLRGPEPTLRLAPGRHRLEARGDGEERATEVLVLSGTSPRYELGR